MSVAQPSLRTVEVILAMLVLLIFTVVMTDLRQPFPSFPTLGGVPINPELLVPGLLGLVALVETVAEGLSVEGVVVGVFALLTLSLATMSLYALYTGAVGGVFAGGLFTLAAGGPLAGIVLVRSAGRTFLSDSVLGRIRNRLGDS